MIENQRLIAQLEPLRETNEKLSEMNEYLTQKNQDLILDGKLLNIDTKHYAMLQQEIDTKNTEIL